MQKINGNVFLTSDWHIQHKNLCKGTSQWGGDLSGCRDFNSPEEMWEVIRDNTNKLVKKDDILINQGDIIFGDKTKLPQFLSEINCKNILYIFGNHCDWMKTEKYGYYQEYFALGCADYRELVINGRLCICSHYAHRTWRDQGKKSIHTYGHSHSSLPDDPNALSIDVGVDTHLFDHPIYTPYSHKELFHIMDNLKQWKKLDHH